MSQIVTLAAEGGYQVFNLAGGEWFWLILSAATAILAIVIGFVLRQGVLAADEGTPTMIEIARSIQVGAMAYLRRQFKTIAIIVIPVAAIVFVTSTKVIEPNGNEALSFAQSGLFRTLAFVGGCFLSGLTGFIGMSLAVRGNVRTAAAARSGSMPKALEVAFRTGGVAGMFTVGLGLFGATVIILIFQNTSSAILIGFGFGGSLLALFLRVGGGIYTKAADVGADLVGKVEAGIPEDDARNPAVIADLVGDNVGDVAGMGADLFESYVGAIVSGMIIAAATLPPEKQLRGVTLALLLAAVGIVASILGTFFVRTEKGDPQTALRNGTMASAILSIVGSFFMIWGWYGEVPPFWAFLSGVVVGMAIGFVAEYYTSGKQVEELAQFCRTGAATNIIQGMGLSYRSTVIPLVLIALAIIISFQCAGFFGIALSAIGMLSIAGITVAVDAYGPISDNAGGIAEMAHMDRHVRQITDSLDAAGNTTAAIAKGFAIGSAALTALALFASYIQAAGLDKIDIMNANVVAGLFIGGIVPFLFAGDAMRAVGRAAFGVVEEVRRQFKEIHGLMEGTARADYARCVDIT